MLEIRHNTIQTISMGQEMLINHFHEWNKQIHQDGWDSILKSMKCTINPEKDQFFDTIVEWLQERWQENYQQFSNQMQDSLNMKNLMDEQMGWPRKRQRDNKLAKRILNSGYFEQWKQVGLHCKLHLTERLTVNHFEKHVKRRYRYEQKYKRLNRFVIDPHTEIKKEDLAIQMWKMSRELGKITLLVAKKYGFMKTKKGAQPFSVEQINQTKLSKLIADEE